MDEIANSYNEADKPSIEKLEAGLADLRRAISDKKSRKTLELACVDLQEIIEEIRDDYASVTPINIDTAEPQHIIDYGKELVSGTKERQGRAYRYLLSLHQTITNWFIRDGPHIPKCDIKTKSVTGYVISELRNVQVTYTNAFWIWKEWTPHLIDWLQNIDDLTPNNPHDTPVERRFLHPEIVTKQLAYWKGKRKGELWGLLSERDKQTIISAFEKGLGTEGHPPISEQEAAKLWKQYQEHGRIGYILEQETLFSTAQGEIRQGQQTPEPESPEEPPTPPFPVRPSGGKAEIWKLLGSQQQKQFRNWLGRAGDVYSHGESGTHWNYDNWDDFLQKEKPRPIDLE